MVEKYKTLRQERKEFLIAVLTDKNEHGKMLYNHRRLDGTIFERTILTPYFKMMIKKCYQENKIKLLKCYIKYGQNHGILIDVLQKLFSCDDDNEIYFNYSSSY